MLGCFAPNTYAKQILPDKVVKNTITMGNMV